MRANLPDPTHFLGKRISRYPDHVITEHIGSGNNGIVFLAIDQKTKSNLAFKFVPTANLRLDTGDREAYLEEARKANQLQHSAVIKYHEVFAWVDEPEGKPGRFSAYWKT